LKYLEKCVPPADAEDEKRRIQIIQMLVAEGASAADAGLEKHPLYLRAFPDITHTTNDCEEMRWDCNDGNINTGEIRGCEKEDKEAEG